MIAPVLVYLENKRPEVVHQLIVNEIADKTVGPSDSMYGFIYLTVPANGNLDAINSLGVLIRVKKIPSRDALDFVLPLRIK